MAKGVLGLIAVSVAALLLFITFYAGSFATSFESNLCYSYAISDIREKVKSANKSGNAGEFQKLEQLLESLPLHGYESNCKEIEAAIENYNQALKEDADKSSAF